MRSLRTSIAEAGCLVALLLVTPAPRADEPAPLRVELSEPRAYGYRVGDVAVRELRLDIPARLHLDEASLPAIGRLGPALELRSIARHSVSLAGGTRLSLRLEYQVFAAPAAVRTYELPVFTLRFAGTPRPEELRIDGWPLVVAPLGPEPASPRTGLGELRPDVEPPLRDAALEQRVLASCAALALVLGGYLALVYFGLPWWGRQQRPFARAYRELIAHGSGEGGWRALHAAFNQAAGQVLFPDAIDAFVGREPRYAPLREQIHAFYARSQAAFFAAAPGGAAGTSHWLRDFARALRDAERGSA